MRLAPLAVAACFLSLTACGNNNAATPQPSISVGSIVSAGVQIGQDACGEGQAIQAAATTPAGLAAAAQAGFSAVKVGARVTKLNGYLQAYCALGAVSAPLTADIAHQIMTASAGVLSTNAAPPALVAAAKAS